MTALCALATAGGEPARPRGRGARNSPASAVIVAALCLPSAAQAHFFVQSYSLPIPFWMYASGALVALMLSFVLIGIVGSVPRWVTTASIAGPHSGDRAPEQQRLGVTTAGWVALLLLTLCILSGLIGPRGAYDNFNMTFFWIVFVLGAPYLTALVGDFYASANPWEALVCCIEQMTGWRFSGCIRAPSRVGHWPAVILYGGFIALELFGNLLPLGLSAWLLAYAAINVVGAWLLGRAAWFGQGEFFGVMLRLIACVAPIARGPDGARWRPPFAGLLDERPTDMGMVVFALFMLSSTAFDGFHSTLSFVNLYWSDINPTLVGHLGLTPREQNSLAARLYGWWQQLCLAGSPFVYLSAFMLTLAGTRIVARATTSVRDLAFRFTLSLIPIALVYHVTHYFVLLLSQGGQIVRLASDPLGLGWNLFGTAHWTIPPVMVSMGAVWHIQVALIVLGHVISVWVAHVQALIEFRSPRRAAASQVPMLFLMMGFTAFGLWILSLPLAA